ncbi:cytochrome P450 26A1-like [Diadema antillarum]|uniref:cytochrome P450 26A1-like n=1 Tax=Diadema antillarum TaxID=105358 RepID=UPI003A86BE81
MSLVVPVCLLVLIKKLWYYYILTTSDQTSTAPLPGGDFGWPIVGETLQVLFQGPAFYEKKFAKFGRVFKTHLFTNPTVRVYGPENIAKILQGENDIVTSRWPSSTRLVLGQYTLAMSQGEEHAFMRKRVFSAFCHSALAGYVSMIQKPVRQAIEKWCQQDQVLAGTALHHLSFRVASDVLCGFDYTDEDVTTLCQKFEDILNGFMSIPFDLPFTPFRRALKACEYIKKTMHENVMRKASLDPSQDTQDAVRILMNLADQCDRETYYKAIKNQVVEFLLSGMATQSSAANTMLYHLARNPRVLQKVREELDEQGLLTDYSPLTLQKINQCRYVMQVVKESLRIVPPTGASFRTALKTFELDGKQIPKGWTIFWSVRETIHLSDTFTDTHTFDPDRFSPERQEDKINGRFAMPVFGQGPRSCIGQNFAMLTLRILLIELARMCDFKVLDLENIKFSWIPSPMPKCGMATRFRRLKLVDQNENECTADSASSSANCQSPDCVGQRSLTCQAA